MPANERPRPLSNTISRRDLLIGAATGTAAIIAALALRNFNPNTENESPIIEANLPMGKGFYIRNAESLTVGNAGIDEIRIFRDADTKMTFVSMKANSDSYLALDDLVSSFGLETLDVGFVPFDPNFDIKKALAALKKTPKANLASTPENVSKVDKISEQMWPGYPPTITIEGFITDPQPGIDYMLVIGANATLPKNKVSPKINPGDFSKGAILRVKFTFTGLDKPPTAPQPIPGQQRV